MKVEVYYTRNGLTAGKVWAEIEENKYLKLAKDDWVYSHVDELEEVFLELEKDLSPFLPKETEIDTVWLGKEILYLK